MTTFCQMKLVMPTDTGYFMYTKSNCKWCTMATKQLPTVTVVNVDHLLQAQKAEFLLTVGGLSGGATPDTFPMVFYNGMYIGGCTDSVEHMKCRQ